MTTTDLGPATAPPRAAVERFRSLDGLRGIAAVVVVIHHGFLTVPVLAAAYFPSTGDIEVGSLGWLLAHTPAHLLWAGTEAVYLFFVLSGVVLVFPVLRNPHFSWLAYYPRRLVRLYGPVIAAAVFGLVTVVLVSRFNNPRFGPWVNARPNQYTGEAFLHDITLVFGASGVISPFWSLRWEVLFSLALPLYVFAARATRRVGWLAFAAVLALVIWSAVHRGESSFYLPMFAIGTLLAVHWDALAALAGWVGRRRGGWAAFIVACLLLTGARWELVGLGMRESQAVEYTWIPVVGVTGLVLAAAFCPELRRRLESPVVQWLGTVSFSLYLVHEPIIIAVRYLTVDQPAWIGVLISVPVSFLVAAVFWRLVERPCHRLSRSTGRRVERLRP